MSLLSVAFCFFLLATLLAFHLLPARGRPLCLLLASYLFYGLASWPHAALLFVLSVVTHRLGLHLGARPEASRNKHLAGAGIALLLGVLLVAKYLPAVAQALRPEFRPDALSLVVPLGISYYTFKLVSYLLDVHWGTLSPEPGFVRFALYPVFFPQIVSGPIQRSGDFLAQLQSVGRVEPARIRRGLRLIVFGLFQKTVVANALAPCVDGVFAAPAEARGLAFLVASYAFAWQLYADFCGLSDMAIGLGALFGIEAPSNFESPYYAPNIQQFWRRWHITLTSWLTDYLFTPLRIQLRDLGGAGLLAAIVVNMVVIGVWHGPRWTYVVFGLVNALYMMGSVLTLKERNRFFKRWPRLDALRPLAGALLVFHMFTLALVFFRADTVADACYVLSHWIPTSLPPGARFRGLQVQTLLDLSGFAFLPFMEIGHLFQHRATLGRWFDASPRVLRWGTYYLAVAAILVFGRVDVQRFIYQGF